MRTWIWGADLGRRLATKRLLGETASFENIDLTESHPSEVLNIVTTPSLTGHRVVVAGPASKLSFEELAEIDSLTDTFTLVLWNERKPAAKALEAAGSFDHVPAPAPSTHDLAELLGLKLEAKSVAPRLERQCNWNRDKVWNVLRLAAASSDGEPVSYGDLEVFIGTAATPLPWNITDAILERDADTAVALAEKPDQEPIPFLAWAAKWLSLLSLATKPDATQESLITTAAVTPRQAKSYLKAAESVTPEQVRKGWEAHAVAETQARSTGANQTVLTYTLDLLDCFCTE